MNRGLWPMPLPVIIPCLTLIYLFTNFSRTKIKVCQNQIKISMTKKVQLLLFCIFCFVFSLQAQQLRSKTTATTVIKAGTSKLTGSIKSPNVSNKDSLYVHLLVPNPISGEFVRYKTLVDQSGKFTFNAPIETTISLARLHTDLNMEQYLLVKLINDGVTNLNVTYNADDEIEKINVTPAANKNDMTEGLEVYNKMMAYKSGRAPEQLYNKSTAYFLDYAKTIFLGRTTVLKNDTLLSKELKEMLFKDARLYIYGRHVLDYKAEMMFNYNNTSDDKSKNPDIQKIDKTYFRFLKEFNLNDPQYLQCFTFLEFQKQILENETIGIPKIRESSIPSWLASVKTILADLVGFNKGPYYDILVANAYARQLTEEIRPLSEKQKKNITAYWKNGEIAKILLRKNQQVVELNKAKSAVVVNDISSVPADKVMETIISKYKNKVVLIDLWATWCIPCLNAMERFRSAKGEFLGKDVVFVYLTDPSSPRKLWEEKIKGIGNEHYYLTAAQWKYIMDHFGFEAIPSYLLYDKKGELITKFTAFPENARVTAMINSLL